MAPLGSSWSNEVSPRSLLQREFEKLRRHDHHREEFRKLKNRATLPPGKNDARREDQSPQPPSE
jgi:hypothetical protein